MPAVQYGFDPAWFAIYGNAGWMAWNTILALAPLTLAALLFRRGRRHSPLWWLGIAAFAVLLPNAPYVLTDVVHLVPDLQRAERLSGALGLLAQYAVLLVVGTLSYVISLVFAVRWLRDRGWTRGTVAVELGAHLACAVGIYLGRVTRLNSWDPLLDPPRVAAALLDLGAARPVALIVLMFALLCAAYWPGKIILLALVAYRSSRHPPWWPAPTGG